MEDFNSTPTIKQHTDDVFDDPKYLERRRLIKKTDEEIVKDGTKEGIASSDSSVTYLTRCIKENKMFFAELSGCDKMTDIGCSDIGVPVATGIRQYIESINRFDLVDPFENEVDVLGNLKNTEAFKFFKMDGLSFLLKQESGSTNTMTASIDSQLINSRDYLLRLAQEIYRVTAENGFYISANSEDLEEEASKLFPFKKEFGQIKVFYKRLVEDVTEFAKEGKIIMTDYENSLGILNAGIIERDDATDLLDHYFRLILSRIKDGNYDQIYSAIRQYINEGSHARKDEKIESVRKRINTFLRKYFNKIIVNIERETGKTLEE